MSETTIAKADAKVREAQERVHVAEHAYGVSMYDAVGQREFSPFEVHQRVTDARRLLAEAQAERAALDVLRLSSPEIAALRIGAQSGGAGGGGTAGLGASTMLVICGGNGGAGSTAPTIADLIRIDRIETRRLVNRLRRKVEIVGATGAWMPRPTKAPLNDSDWILRSDVDALLRGEPVVAGTVNLQNEPQ